ncbi:hypothetical protein NIES4106_02540 [Fischerella sp. NIES-4106]|jgi:hypothetical protein|nr:hypothetical protein NIES4106_02540 [Fischerella sp. NIES-4106]
MMGIFRYKGMIDFFANLKISKEYFPINTGKNIAIKGDCFGMTLDNFHSKRSLRVLHNLYKIHQKFLLWEQLAFKVFILKTLIL